MKKPQKNPVIAIGEISLLKSIKDLNTKIILCGENEENLSWYSKYAHKKIRVPSYDTPEFIEKLCKIGKDLNRKAVIYSDDDRALLNISNNRKQLKEYYLFLYPELKMLQKILDKQAFIKLSDQHELPTPISRPVKTVSTVFEVAEKMPYPCVIKPTERHYWWGENFINAVGYYKKAIKCSSPQELIDTYIKIATVNSSVVIQEYVVGPDKNHYSINLFVTHDGKIKGYYICRKFRIYPRGAGVGTIVVTVDLPKLFNISRKIIQKLDLVGLVNLQFKKDQRTGDYKLLEIQNRNSMYSLIGNVAGAPLAEINYKYMTGQKLSDTLVTAKEGVKYIDLVRDLKAFKQYHEAGEINLSNWIRSLKGVRVFSMISYRDPGPVIYETKRIIKSMINKNRKGSIKSLLPKIDKYSF